MVWSAVSGLPMQRDKSDGTLASGYYLKFYDAGTTTPASMSTDSTGGTTLAKCQVDSNGDYINGSGDVFVPHIDRDYKAVLYTNATDADNDTTASAVWVVDNLKQFQVGSTDIWNLYSGTPTQTSATTFTVTGDQRTTFAVGTRLKFTDASTLYGQVTSVAYTTLTTVTVTLDTGSLSGSLTEVYTSQSDVTSKPIGSPSVSYLPAGSGAVDTNVQAKLRETVSVTDFGAVGDGVTDDLVAIQRCVDAVGVAGGGTVFFPNGNYLISSNTVTGVNQFGIAIRYSNIRLVFESKSAVILPDRTILQKAISITSDVSASNPSTTLYDIEILGGTIDGQNDQSGAATNESSHCIDIRNAQRVKIHGMKLRRFRGDGLYIAYGSQNVWVFNNFIDGNRASSVSGVRQGVAVLSGREINIYDNHIQSCLIGVDLEPDDNQISAGYNYLKRVNVHHNYIRDMGSEGIALIAPLATSALDVTDINCESNILIDIDEALIDFDLETVNGQAERIRICGNISDGSNTFKGMNIGRMKNILIDSNVFPGNPGIGIHVFDNVDDITITNNVVSSTGGDACRLQESSSSTRVKATIANNNFESSSGDGLQIQGAWDAVVSGGNYVGTVSGISLQGSTVSGTATDLHAIVDGARLECTVNTGYSLVCGADIAKMKASSCNLINASGATNVSFIDSGVPKSMFYLNCEADISGAIYSDTRLVINNGDAPNKAVVTDAVQHSNTTAELEDISDTCNLVGKHTGKMVLNSTTGVMVFSAGNVAGSVWRNVDGTTAHTPV